MRRRLAWLVPFVLSTAPVLAQEHMSILEQKHWWVGAVCVGVNQCAFCNAADAAEDGTTLRVQPPGDVSLSLPEGVSATSAALAIGGEQLASPGETMGTSRQRRATAPGSSRPCVGKPR